MNIKYLIAAAAIALPALLGAKPADPRLRTVKNPDGTTIQIRVHGDEHFNFMTDAERSTILERNADGFYVKAMRNGKPLAFNKDNVEMLRAEAPVLFPTFEASDNGARSGMQRMATLNSEGRSNYPTIGKGNRSLVVLVEFQDVEFTVPDPKEYFTRQLNEPGFSDYGGKGSAIDYYKAISNGLYQPQFDVYGPVKVSKNAAYFKDNNSGNMGLLIREALTQLHDAGEIDFSNYDFDENGIVDTVFIYYAGYGSADSQTETIWPHQYDYQYLVNYFGQTQLRFDGKKIGPYACGNELKGYNPETRRQPWLDGSEPWVDGIGTFVHEYGHVLGLPDLYDVEYSDKAVTPGIWDVMDAGCYNFEGCVPPLYSAYEQWVCRWLEYTDAEDASHYDLKSLGATDTPTAVRIRIPMSSDGKTFQSEYFVIESRDNSGWDACFPDSGLLVWRINYKKNLWTGNSVNSKSSSNVEIVYAKNEIRPVFTEGAIYSGGDVELKPSRNYSLWKSPVITGIGYDADTKTGMFDYNMVEPTDVATVLHDVPYADADGARAFTLTWDPVEGVDSYRVTVTTKSGKIIDGYDGKNVGNVNTAYVSGLSSAYWKLEMQAYVTCVVQGMNSTATSNVIKFKPSDLPKDNAVEGVEDSAIIIRGGEGRVIAPEGAVVYSVAGQRVHNAGLAPGIYIVSYGARTVKVMVR